MKNLKDKLYDFVVRKNENVRYEYERYVQEHLVEHYEGRARHWKILRKLIWHYRVNKKNEPMLYWDREVNCYNSQKENMHNEAEEKKKISVLNIGPESKMSKRPVPAVVARELLKYDVISFDIFDTLILRCIEKPEDLFVMVEKENRIFDFATLRKRAESLVRTNLESTIGSRDATIYEIYDYIQRETGIDSQSLIQQEFEMEKKVCFANPYMKQILDILHEQGKRIIITSDMYYPKEMMEELLSNCQISGYEKIYVSCDYRKSKRKGTLYSQIKSDIGAEKSICHIGDNRDVDIEMAQQQGLNTYYYRAVNAIGRNSRVKDMSPMMKSVYCAVVNSWFHASDKTYSPQYEYGFIYGGIYILGYVNWIYNYAKINGIEKVLFLARDSDILKDVFDMQHSDIRTEYLYWGRLPSFKYTLKEDQYGFLKRNIQDRVNRKSKITIGTLIELLDITFLKEVLEQYNLRENDILSNENSQNVKTMFLYYMPQIREQYEKESYIAKEYVKSVIGDAKKIAIVDIGWKGTEPLSLKRLLCEKWKIVDEVRCLMAGSYGNKWNVQDKTFDVYMFSQIDNVNNTNFLQKNVSYYTLAFELFGRMRCEGRFKGFSKDEKGIHMNFEKNLVENHYDMKEMKNGIMDFVSVYTEKVAKFEYLLNISGYDAYAPSKLLVREKKYLEAYFPYHKIELDAGDDEGNIRTYIQYIKENGF